MFVNHYQILGVEPDADLVQITAAWKRLLKKYHPDLNQDEKDATEQTILLNKAYEVLSNAKKRKKFDKQLREQEQTAESPEVFEDGNQEESAPNPEPFAQANEESSSHAQTFEQTFEQTTNQDTPFSAAANRNARKNRYAAISSVIGILLGALTAIPIGLFLVWAISGFDPLGIFRQESDSNIASGDGSEEAGIGATENGDTKQKEVKPSKSLAPPAADERKKDVVEKDVENKEEIPDKITISYAKFGESRQSTRVERYVEDVASKTGIVTSITTEGLYTTNPFGGYRTALRVTYQINGEKTGTLSFPNGAQVMIREAILKHAKENARPFEKIEITYALFGKQRNKVRCEEQVAAVASQIDTISPITTHGLSLRNPSGRVRHELDIEYEVAGKTGSLTLKYGQKVDLRKTILEHAGVVDGSYASNVAASGDAPDRDPATINDASTGQSVKKPDESEASKNVKQPIPPQNEVSVAKDRIAEIFKEKYEAANKAKGFDRLEKLRNISLDIAKLAGEESDLASLYAIYEVAVNIGKQSCFGGETLEIVDEFQKKFEIDHLIIRLGLFEYWHSELNRIHRENDSRSAAAYHMALLIEPFMNYAIKERRWDLAKRYSELAAKLYLASGDKTSQNELLVFSQRLEILASRQKVINEYVEDLKLKPDQPEKSHAVGIHYCLFLEDWAIGLPYLKASANSKLSACATADLSAINESYESVGDGWWELAFDDEFLQYRSTLAMRAKHYYNLALPGSTGLRREGLSHRIVQAVKLYAEKKPMATQRNTFTSSSTGMKFNRVDPGSFMMGEFMENIKEFGDDSPNYLDETPRHKITITQAFYLGKYEVTQKQWITIMGTEPWKGRENTRSGDGFAASCVTWSEATEFCKRLSQKEQVKYRLPTEAEWEYACRAGTETRYSFGNQDAHFSEYGWCRENAWNTKNERFAHQVGLKKPNPWGFHDLHGNVAEWCQDLYDTKFYNQSPNIDPLNDSKESKNRILRGGSFYLFSYVGRSADRTTYHHTQRCDFAGFRVVMEP